jgi:hypothetical protein
LWEVFCVDEHHFSIAVNIVVIVIVKQILERLFGDVRRGCFFATSGWHILGLMLN